MLFAYFTLVNDPFKSWVLIDYDIFKLIIVILITASPEVWLWLIATPLVSCIAIMLLLVVPPAAISKVKAVSSLQMVSIAAFLLRTLPQSPVHLLSKCIILHLLLLDGTIHLLVTSRWTPFAFEWPIPDICVDFSWLYFLHVLIDIALIIGRIHISWQIRLALIVFIGWFIDV